MLYKIEEFKYDIILESRITKYSQITTLNRPVTLSEQGRPDVPFDLVTTQATPYELSIV